MSSLDRQKEIGTTAASQAGEAHAGAASPDLPSTPTFLTEAIREPWRFDFFNMMRRLGDGGRRDAHRQNRGYG